MTNLRHFDNLGTARFVSFSCYRRQANLKSIQARSILIEEIRNARLKYKFQLYAYVLMPEYVHLVLLPSEGMKLGRVIGEIKSLSARRFFIQSFGDSTTETRIFWEKRCYDHNCRTPEDLWIKVNYCHFNPVKRGLVTDPSDWQWSSFNWYQGRVDVPILMDKVDKCYV